MNERTNERIKMRVVFIAAATAAAEKKPLK